MRRICKSGALLGTILWGAGTALGQDPPTATPATEEKTASEVDATAVTVNGHAITERDVHDMSETMMTANSRGRTVPPAQRAMMMERMRSRVLDTLIDNRLLDDDADLAEINVTDQDLSAEYQRLLDAYLLQSGSTQAEFAKQIKEREGQTLDEFSAERRAEPQFQRNVRYAALLEKRYPDELTVADDAVKTKYESLLDRVYTKPETVRASHILLRTDQGKSEDDIVKDRATIESILVEIRKPDADFAAMATEHSDCPSAAKGGDLGYFPRTGKMVEPFAAAAFALKVGEISAVVETQFGFHIITVTDRTEAEVTTLEEAAGTIRSQLRAKKLAELKTKHLAELKKEAKITYPATPETPAPEPAP